MHSSTRWLTVVATVVATVLVAGWTSGAQERLTGGAGTLYLGTQDKAITIIDEATEKVVGAIRMKTGIPGDMTLSDNRKRFYITNVNYEDVEIADIATRTVVDTIRLSEANRKIRIFQFRVDPLDRFAIMLTRTTTRHPDRMEVGPPVIQQYDLQAKKIVRTIPWPDNEERQFANFLFSPDGSLLYFFAEDILVFETKEFTQVDKWELSRPLEDGLGRISLGAIDVANDEPGYFTGLFRVEDPVQHRRMMGVARVNLKEKAVDFYAIGPSSPVSFAMAPDRKLAYGLYSDIGRYEFWTFDLVNRTLQSRVPFEGRPRMSIRTSSNGRLLYIHNAGNTIDLWDAATYRYLRTITLDGDMTTDLLLLK